MVINDNYRKTRDEAINWLNSEQRPFEEGLAILSRSGFKPVVVANLLRKGDKPHTREKLVYEMRQMIQVWYNPDDPIYEDVDLSDDAVPGEDGRPETLTAEVNQSMLAAAEEEDRRQADEQPSYPPVIAALIYEFRRLYVERDKLHNVLGSMGETNQPDVVAKRMEMVQRIASISERMSFIHAIRTSFEQSQSLPDSEQLDKAYGRQPISVQKQQSPVQQSKVDDEEAFLAMSVDELKKEKANAQSKITKMQNMLLYSSKTKPEDGIENPLPDCPARVTYERKLSRQKAWVEKINYRLAELS